MANTKKHDLHSIERGEGTPLVLLHGFPFDHALWKEQLHGVASKGARIIALDLPGFGRSNPLDGDEATMDAYADAIAEWAEKEGLEKFVLAGHSMGGYIAFAFARRHMEMLSGLILVCTRPGADSDAGKEGRYKLITEVEKRGPQGVVDAMLPKLFAAQTAKERPEIVAETREMVLRQSREGIITAIRSMAERPDSTPGLDAIKVPTLIITGAEDAIIPAPEADGLLSSIPHAKHVSIKGGGHMPMLENPNAFNKALKAFIRTL